MASTTRGQMAHFLGFIRERLSNLTNPRWFVAEIELEAARRSEFGRIREERRAALAVYKAALNRGDKRRQGSTGPAAKAATNAALRGGL